MSNIIPAPTREWRELPGLLAQLDPISPMLDRHLDGPGVYPAVVMAAVRARHLLLSWRGRTPTMRSAPRVRFSMVAHEQATPEQYVTAVESLTMLWDELQTFEAGRELARAHRQYLLGVTASIKDDAL
ncbi:hypothetical protein [Luteococcus peritonei]|uniref:SAV-6107-like HEPN domain-containing protein n=1 Tax=Luteococcus peritonei TaxID=88874 RepID=A0ABW4RVK3_9ACTN